LTHGAIPPFVALDVETASRDPASICAVGLTTFHEMATPRLSPARFTLLRPDTPAEAWRFSALHGIDAARVAHSPTFAEQWPDLNIESGPVAFLAAHNAAFDRRAIFAACARAGIAPPRLPWLCTMKLAAKFWHIERGRLSLPAVCRRVGVKFSRELGVHDATADAIAVGEIVLAAWRAGADLSREAYRLPPLRAARAAVDGMEEPIL
jgi:DNA polymerase-3 subunit epsilon